MRPTAIAPRQRFAVRHEPDTGTRDAVADLADWLTDTHLGTTTGFGGEALAAVTTTLGRDSPASHADCGRDFRCVLESLQDALLGMMEARSRGR
jgi:hypothetical protein